MSNYYDRFHFVVEDVHGNIIARNVVPMEPIVSRVLSGPASIQFKIHPKDPSIQLADGSGPIQLKPWGHIIHALKYGLDGTEQVWASGIMQPSDVDPQTGIMSVQAQGFSNYAKGLPWLENWNPIAVDPFEIVSRIWTHIQSYAQGNLNVTVYPSSSGTQMLPGFSFENEEFIQDFFAIFIRESDRNDCGDYITKLARDIPFDYLEETTRATPSSAFQKKIKLAYPYGGVDQEALVFRAGENIISATPKQEVEVDWFSDIIINGYFPGKVYSATISNADTNRLRRVMSETDLHINSNERAAAWGHKKLSRRQWPAGQFESIVIDPYHPNAPHGSFDVGDIIRIQGEVPWYGNLNVKHKIMSHTWDETKGIVQLGVRAEGTFNYDPIAYLGS